MRIGSGIYVLAANGSKHAETPAESEAPAGPYELLRARYVIEAECAALAAKSAKRSRSKPSRERWKKCSASTPRQAAAFR